MAIDLVHEQGISALQATKLFPSARTGCDTHVSRVIRLIKRGDLEGARVGTQWVTTLEAVQRFCERQETGQVQPAPATDAPETAAPRVKGVRTTAQRRRDNDRAKRDLVEMGVRVK